MSDDPKRFWQTHQSVLDRQNRDGQVYSKECAGALRVEGERPLVVRCDVCGELMGVRGDAGTSGSAPRDSDKRSRRRRRSENDDDPLLGAT